MSNYLKNDHHESFVAQNAIHTNVTLNELDLHPFNNPIVPQSAQRLPPRRKTIKDDYAIIAEGGFSVESGFVFIDISSDFVATRYDLTQTLQIEIPASLFNIKLDITKNNGELISNGTNFDVSNNNFISESIIISSTEFLNSFLHFNIISLGFFDTIYNDFIGKVNRYFGIKGVDDDLVIQNLDGSDDGFLNKLEFYNTIAKSNSANEYSLNGNIIISGINILLRTLTLNNVFNNRLGKTIRDGFIAGDKILMRGGLHVVLQLNIDTTTYSNQVNRTVDGSNNGYSFTQPYYSDASASILPNLANNAVGDILFVLT
jgi:hypothetical protein